MQPMIVELSETADGGMYALVEFRVDPASPDPDVVEDFTWNLIPGGRRRYITDPHGRVRIRGQWVWPVTEIDGDLRQRDDLDQADLAPVDAEAVENAILRTVVAQAEKLTSGRRMRAMPEGMRPPRGQIGDPGTRARLAALLNRPVTEKARP